ncbi:MAG TPA: aminotransferase class I/II-fold pyridoxal phosphate-dependent enzyme [Anaerohalosphaeraceae bacterium]|nr:aminotransferase class I/II-fold pyridoxal phosphate-dependent enzyme [Anaerohalosphaeraceae bacterium]HOL88628.1 aminotransferase class I/II-fold pyridoxal phosphate-dependent enzyme [Anaerohalosphaeraceae bacterium]HPP56224.1 aminotransferase class I/II-fold pyridoxal phosphate-dependent enzyme [Anaerohalosphaeraceae bacterium]
MADYLAQRTRKIDASGIRKVFALADKLQNPVNFSIGQPDFDVPEPIKQAAVKAILDGLNRYSPTSGDARLLEKVRSKVRQETGWEEPLCMITSGVSGGLLLAFMALVDPGDEVILIDPYFVIYKHVVNLLGGKCVFVDSYPDFRLPVEKIAQAVTARTKMIILNSPANPTGTVYTEEEVRAVAQIACRHNLILLSDEIYDVFSYDHPNPCVGRFYEKTLLLKGFSKSAAMTGWRMGYAACTKALAPLMEAMNMIQQYTFVCAPTPFQIASIAALEFDIRPYVEQYRQKRDRLVEGLKGYYHLEKPGGAFYLFVQKPDWAASATEFVKTAIENNVLIIPGNVFSEKDTHFRISYAATEQTIDRGIEILRRLAKR